MSSITFLFKSNTVDNSRPYKRAAFSRRKINARNYRKIQKCHVRCRTGLSSDKLHKLHNLADHTAKNAIYVNNPEVDTNEASTYGAYSSVESSPENVASISIMDPVVEGLHNELRAALIQINEAFPGPDCWKWIRNNPELFQACKADALLKEPYHAADAVAIHDAIDKWKNGHLKAFNAFKSTL